MQLHHWWWLLALALGVAEFVTATFYVLVLAVAAAIAGVAAWLGAGLGVQSAVLASVAALGWIALWRRNPSRGAVAAPGHDRSLLVAAGEELRIDDWHAARRTGVQYRGGRWEVDLDPGAAQAEAGSGAYVITRIEGRRLIVRPLASDGDGAARSGPGSRPGART